MNAESIIAKVKKPTQAEAKALSTYFLLPKVHQNVHLTLQLNRLYCLCKRKKSVRRKGNGHAMSPSFQIPKGQIRQRLGSKGRILNLRITRSMTNQEVKNQVIRAFKVDKFVVLECDSTGHNLVKAGDQTIDGEKVVDRKGALYLCEKFEYVSNQNNMLHALIHRYKVSR